MKTVPYTVRDLGGAPVFTAAPRPDREPERRNQPPAPLVDEKKTQPNPAAFTPDAVETWRRQQEEGARRDRAGAIRVNVAITSGPGIPRGAQHWSYHPAHEDPPIFVPGAIYATASGNTSRAARLFRQMSEDEAARRYRDGVLREVDAPGNVAAWKIAKAMHGRRK